MGKLFGFGRTISFHKAPFVVIPKVPSSPMMTTVGLVHCELITLGHLTLSTSLFLPNFKILFRVFLWHDFLESLTLFCGPITTVPVQLNSLLNLFFNSNKYLGINRCGTRFGHYHAKKDPNFLLKSYA